MSVKLLTEQHLEFLSLKGGCTGSSESTLVKMPYCWKSRVAAPLRETSVLIASEIYSVFTFSKQSFNESLDFGNRS